MSVIAVSAGHHAAAQGAKYNNLTEWAEAVHWQRLICNELEALGDIPLSVDHAKLPAKVKQINSFHPRVDLAIEIHFNSAPGRAGTGSESLYCPGSVAGEGWATAIQRSLVPFCSPNRGVKEGWYRLDKPGQIDYAGDVEGDEVVGYFLRKTRAPAVIVEPYFIHEAPRIIANREIVCQVLAETIHERFLQLGG